MKNIEELIRKKKQIRVVGFDDAPFSHERGSSVNVAGIVCSQTRFEGMLWLQIEKDGSNATEAVSQALLSSKFYAQVHAILIDGIAFGGFNIVDLPSLARVTQRPCIAVMKKAPNLGAIDSALKNFEDYSHRKSLIEAAGEIYERGGFFFQVSGCEPELASAILRNTTDTGSVPEALRIAHFVGAAVETGQSSSRA